MKNINLSEAIALALADADAERHSDNDRIVAELRNGFWTLRKAIGEYTSRRGNHQRDDHSPCVLCDAMEATRNLADSLRREGHAAKLIGVE